MWRCVFVTLAVECIYFFCYPYQHQLWFRRIKPVSASSIHPRKTIVNCKANRQEMNLAKVLHLAEHHVGRWSCGRQIRCTAVGQLEQLALNIRWILCHYFSNSGMHSCHVILSTENVC